jgi:DNA-binding CsgD family transcriptional regulator
MKRFPAWLGYGLLVVSVLACLQLLRLAPPLWGWARELVGAAIAIVAVGVGLKLAQRPPPPPARPRIEASELTPREREVLALLCEGASNKDMARALHLSENTVKTHLASLYAKLQVGKRTEAQAAAYRLGLVRTDKESAE